MKKIFFLLFPYFLSAHPHIFIEASVDILTQKNMIRSFTMNWNFSQMNSAMMIMDYDTNHDNDIDADEMAVFKKDFFDKSKEGSYYTTVVCDDKEIDISDKIDSFHIAIKNKRFIVSFVVLVPLSKHMTIGLWDQDNYTAFDIFKEVVKIDNKNIYTDVQEVETDFYFGYKVVVGEI